MEILTLLISAILINNFVLHYFIGLCPFLGVSKKLDSALSMGVSVTFVMAITAVFLLDYQPLDSNSKRARLPPDCLLYSRHRIISAACGDVHPQDQPSALAGNGNLPPPHHDQLLYHGTGSLCGPEKL